MDTVKCFSKAFTIKLSSEGNPRQKSACSTGVKVECGVTIGRDLSFADFRKRFDAVYLSIGAHGAKRLGIDGEDAQGVLSAVELLGASGAGERPDFTGRRVVVVGGGNVAMDATRTARRLGAASVTCVYRRRIADMTALPEEVAGAQAEGCEIVQLMAPVRVAVEDGHAVGLVVKPQIAGPLKGGRPAPVDAAAPEETIPCDIVVVAIGQDIDSAAFAAEGLDVKRGAFVASPAGEVKSGGSTLAGVFTGGDCYTGPATVIRAIDAGKVAAKNIASELHISFASLASSAVRSSHASPVRLYCGRVNASERPADERKNDFCLMERCLTDEEAMHECSRCLRCDQNGWGRVGV